MKVLVTGGSGFIGTRLVSDLLTDGAQVMNVDIAPPHVEEHIPVWRRVDIMDASGLHDVFGAFRPEAVVHLAARTDTDTDVVDEYLVNSVGTANVLAAFRAAAVRRFVLTSSQFVVGPGPAIARDDEYRPHTAYGASKVAAEQLLRTEYADVPWVITRPTNIWGPWHPRYPQEFWRVLSRGLYVHPGGRDVVRCYGYVGTVSDQTRQLLVEPAAVGQTYYLGDAPAPLSQWVDAFSVALTGHPARRVPRLVLRSLASVGDLLIAVGLRAPLTTSRYRSMTQDYLAPMGRTFDLLGRPRYDLAQGVAETVAWLRRSNEGY